MRLLIRRNTVVYCLLRPVDASPWLAHQIMQVHSSAFMGRYTTVDPQIVKELLKADEEDTAHIRSTFDNLTSEAWYWIVAIDHQEVVAFGVFAPRGDSVHIVELHTRPEAWRQRHASIIMLLGLEYARRKGATKVSLAVDMAKQNDSHPYRWYESLGFTNAGCRGELWVGTIRLLKFDMVASLKVVHQRLRQAIGH